MASDTGCILGTVGTAIGGGIAAAGIGVGIARDIVGWSPYILEIGIAFAVVGAIAGSMQGYASFCEEKDKDETETPSESIDVQNESTENTTIITSSEAPETDSTSEEPTHTEKSTPQPDAAISSQSTEKALQLLHTLMRQEQHPDKVNKADGLKYSLEDQSKKHIIDVPNQAPKRSQKINQLIIYDTKKEPLVLIWQKDLGPSKIPISFINPGAGGDYHPTTHPPGIHP